MGLQYDNCSRVMKVLYGIHVSGIDLESPTRGVTTRQIDRAGWDDCVRARTRGRGRWMDVGRECATSTSTERLVSRVRDALTVDSRRRARCGARATRETTTRAR